MPRLTKILLAGVSALSAAAGFVSDARAADYSPPQPCYDASLIAAGRAPANAVPCYTPQPVVVEEFASWYLRGDIGFTNQQIRSLTNIQDVSNDVQNIGIGFDASPLFGLGLGYYFNDWLRVDVTGEYRSRANFHGLQIIDAGSGPFTDEYRASKSEWLFLANAYFDLGTWNALTPYVGAGVGFSRNTIHSFLDVCTTCPGGGVAYADTISTWNFAWALHAGVSYKITKNVALDLSYRFVHLGDAESGDIITYEGTNNVNNPMMFNGLTSHDLRLGLRVNLDAFTGRTDYAPPAPVSVYASQPVPQYSAPPLQTPPQYAPPPVYAPQPQYAPQPYPQQQYYPAPQPYGRRS